MAHTTYMNTNYYLLAISYKGGDVSVFPLYVTDRDEAVEQVARYNNMLASDETFYYALGVTPTV